MNLLRRRSRKEVKAIKMKDGDNTSKISKEQMDLQKKLLENNVREVEVIKEFSKGNMTPMQLQEKLMPVEMDRIDTAIKYSGIKIEKKVDLGKSKYA